MAVWDLLGKELRMPVYELLGGRLRDCIPVTGGVGMASMEDMIRQARQAVENGHKEVKIKVGLDEEKDLSVVKHIRNAIPDEIRLRADANMAWKDRKTAKRMMDALSGCGVEIIEQPLDYRDFEGLAWLRENTSNRILLDESIWDWHDASRAISAGAADLFHVYVSEAGGIDGMRRVFNIAGAFFVDCTVGAMPEGVIGSCAAAHVAAAMPNLSASPSDLRGFTSFADDVAESALRLEDGVLKLPEGPGLGFEVDEDKLSALRADR